MQNTQQEENSSCNSGLSFQGTDAVTCIHPQGAKTDAFKVPLPAQPGAAPPLGPPHLELCFPGKHTCAYRSFPTSSLRIYLWITETQLKLVQAPKEI